MHTKLPLTLFLLVMGPYLYSQNHSVKKAETTIVSAFIGKPLLKGRDFGDDVLSVGVTFDFLWPGKKNRHKALRIGVDTYSERRLGGREVYIYPDFRFISYYPVHKSVYLEMGLGMIIAGGYTGILPSGNIGFTIISERIVGKLFWGFPEFAGMGIGLNL